MSVRPANEILPSGVPAYCSACGCQDPEKRHVDFDAACDRGYGDDTTIMMDDLVLCETCLRSGAVFVDMIDSTEAHDRIASLEARLDEEKKRADKAAAYAERMEQALAARPAPVKVSRPRGRPPKPRQEAVVA